MRASKCRIAVGTIAKIAQKWVLPIFALTFLVTVPLVAADSADLTLLDGRVLKQARITAIDGASTTISTAGSVLKIATDLVPLESLARAQMAIDAKTEATKKTSAAVAKRDEEARSPEGIQKAKVTAIANAPSVPKLSPTMAEQRLIDLKQKFPEQIMVKIHAGTVPAPGPDDWHAYEGDVRVATLQSLPVVTQRLEDRMAADLKRLREDKDMMVRPIRTEYEAWLNTRLKPYLAKLKTLNGAR